MGGVLKLLIKVICYNKKIQHSSRKLIVQRVCSWDQPFNRNRGRCLKNASFYLGVNIGLCDVE